MNESRDLVPVAPLLITVIAVAGITSAVWSVFWQQRHADLTQRLAVQTERGEESRAAHEQLLEQYLNTEQMRLQQSRDMFDLQQELDTSRRRLAELEAGNWPARYRELEDRNYELSERIEELQLSHDIARDNITAEHEQLQTRFDDLEQAFITLELEHDALRERHNQTRQAAAEEKIEHRVALSDARQRQDDLRVFQRALERDLIHEEINNSSLNDRVAQAQEQRQALNARLEASEQQLHKLRQRELQLSAELEAARENASVPAPARSQPPPPVKKLAQQEQPEPVTVAAGGADPGFRVARLQSLKAAVADASSRDRRMIILTVLPTIPDGVRGNELADLVTGMEGPDIVALIESGRSHIQRPLDNASYERIMQHLTDADSRRRVTALLQ